jgi:AcrR family transcriptional regulator
MSGNDREKTGDRRTRRTRAALIEAFNDLVLSHRKKTIKVADIVEHANVGRSTFYEHYANAADIHMEALSRPFSILADALAGKGDEAKLVWLLEHFWESRQRARASFDGETRTQTSRLLVKMVEERLVARDEARIPTRLVALQLAEGTLGLIRGWVSGEASASTASLAAAIIATSDRILAESGASPDNVRDDGEHRSRQDETIK